LSKNVAVFVDVANLYYSARSQEVDVDYVALLKAATKGRDLIRAYAYSGLDPENENQRKFIDFLGKNGYKVIHKDIRKFGDGRVKANLDIELVVDLFRLADRMDIAVIISGDGDFAPAIRALQDQGVRCEVISFRPNTSSDLMAVADEFIDVMKIIGIGRSAKAEKEEKAEKPEKPEKATRSGRAAASMSAPEMPAKEVVPEFGFREAPPSVAAAALAALREGREPRESSRGRGRGRGRTSAAGRAATREAAEDAVPAVPAARAEEVDAGRRRRRRRGGRGRGRGRGRGGAPVGEAGASEMAQAEGTIGWQEFDDISQLGQGEDVAAGGYDPDREVTFEEADAATLAELGIAEQPAARRARSRRPAAAETAEPAAAAREPEVADPAAAAAASPAGRTRRGTASRPKSGGTKSGSGRSSKASSAVTAAETSGDRAPRRRARTTRAASPTTEGSGSDQGEGSAAADGGETEGIWQRFRSGRTTSRRGSRKSGESS